MVPTFLQYYHLDIHYLQQGSAAMLMEETAAQYIIAQECDKYTVGHLEDRHYAFAFKKG